MESRRRAGPGSCHPRSRLHGDETRFGTAEIYGPFPNEELLGRVLGDSRRDKVVLATRFGFDLTRPTGSDLALDRRPEHTREVVGAMAEFRPDRQGAAPGAVRGQRTQAAEYPEGDYRRSHPRPQEGNFDANLRLLAKLDGVATLDRDP
ncbi:MAG: aldo/keto reductase [Proteobacteria bacterium]|nr:aldo/keto reductase [Pseudomonadota bacterium]